MILAGFLVAGEIGLGVFGGFSGGLSPSKAITKVDEGNNVNDNPGVKDNPEKSKASTEEGKDKSKAPNQKVILKNDPTEKGKSDASTGKNDASTEQAAQKVTDRKSVV